MRACGLLLTFLLSGCSIFVADQPAAREGISIELTPTELVITNDTREEVFTQAVGRNMSARVNWCHCVKEGTGLPPGEQQRIPRGEIPLHAEGEEEIIVYWWHGVVEDGSYVAGEVQHEIVPL